MMKTTALILAGALCMAAGGMVATGQGRAGGAGAATMPAALKTGQVFGGEWKVTDGVLTESVSETPALLLFGDEAWKDYTFEVEGQVTEGAEGFLIVVRGKDSEHLVWFNVGGWGNTRTAFEVISDEGKSDEGEAQTYGTFAEVQTGKWHKLKVEVKETSLEGFVDGKSACKVSKTPDMRATGKVGVGTWDTQAKFRNFKVTDAAGKVLWEGAPAVEKKSG